MVPCGGGEATIRWLSVLSCFSRVPGGWVLEGMSFRSALLLMNDASCHVSSCDLSMVGARD